MSELKSDWDKFNGEMPGNKALTVDEEEQVNQLFKPWLIMWSKSRREREFFCTCCHTRFTARWGRLYPGLPFEYDEYADYLLYKHRDMATCPGCGRDAEVISAGRMGHSCRKMRERINVVILRPERDGFLRATAYAAYKEYIGKEWEVSPELRCVSQYMFKPGIAVHLRKQPWHYCSMQGEVSCSVHTYKAAHITEPFRPGQNDWWSGQDSKEYHVIGLDRISETDMRYSGAEAFLQNRRHLNYGLMKYLGEYCHRPQLEMVAKLGLEDIIDELIFHNRSNVRLLRWKAKDLPSFLRLDKRSTKVFLNSEHRTVQELAILQSMKAIGKYDPEIIQYLSGSKMSASLIRDVAECASGRSLLRVVHYLQKQETREAAALWVDYVRMARKLDYALEDDVVLFPRDLQASHDASMVNIKIKNADELNKKYDLRRKGLNKQYEFEDGTYCIMVPESPAEIIREGAAQHHCVGNYAEAHLKGRTTILFVRKVAERDVPYGTMEFQEGRVRQLRGDHNNNIPAMETTDFIERWKAWVESGSPRDAKGNPIETEMREEKTTA